MKTPLVVDNTMLSNFRACPRKWQYFVDEGFRKSLIASPLNFGSVIHAGKADFEKSLALSIPFEQAKEQAISVAIRSWREQEESPDEWRTLDKAVQVLDELLQRDTLAPVLFPDGQPIVEKDFAVPLIPEDEMTSELVHLADKCGYDGILYSGIIDFVGRFLGKLYVVDHKTCSQLRGDKRKGEAKYIPNEWWNQFKPHSATAGYLYGASFFFEEPISGIIINAIGIDKRGDEVIISKRTFEYSQEEIEEWRQDTIATIVSMLRYKVDNYFPRNSDSCQSWNRNCTYWDLCKVRPSLRDNLESLYVVDKWDPLQARKRESEKLEG